MTELKPDLIQKDKPLLSLVDTVNSINEEKRGILAMISNPGVKVVDNGLEIVGEEKDLKKHGVFIDRAKGQVWVVNSDSNDDPKQFPGIACFYGIPEGLPGYQPDEDVKGEIILGDFKELRQLKPGKMTGEEIGEEQRRLNKIFKALELIGSIDSREAGSLEKVLALELNNNGQERVRALQEILGKEIELIRKETEKAEDKVVLINWNSPYIDKEFGLNNYTGRAQLVDLGGTQGLRIELQKTITDQVRVQPKRSLIKKDSFINMEMVNHLSVIVAFNKEGEPQDLTFSKKTIRPELDNLGKKYNLGQMSYDTAISSMRERELGVKVLQKLGSLLGEEK